jgi:hypothetical protein
MTVLLFPGTGRNEEKGFGGGGGVEAVGDASGGGPGQSRGGEKEERGGGEGGERKEEERRGRKGEGETAVGGGVGGNKVGQNNYVEVESEVLEQTD